MSSKDGMDGGCSAPEKCLTARTRRACRMCRGVRGACGALGIVLAVLLGSLGLLGPFGLAARPALAAGLVDRHAECTLTIHASFGDGGSMAIPNMTLDLYPVATLDESSNLRLMDDYAGSGVNLGSISLASDWDSSAATLLTWVGENNIAPMRGAVTDADGIARFTGLDSGVYLVSGRPVKMGGHTYAPAAYLVGVPNLSDDEWSYDIVSECEVAEVGVVSYGSASKGGTELSDALAGVSPFVVGAIAFGGVAAVVLVASVMSLRKR